MAESHDHSGSGISRPSSRASLVSFEGHEVRGNEVGQRSFTPWDGSREVPQVLRGLDRGLKQRQLDSIAFFLKSNESLFRKSAAVDSEHEGFVRGDTSSDPQLNTLGKLMQLVLAAVHDNVQQVQLRHFTQQLLHLVLEFLQKVTKLVIEDLRGKHMAENCPDMYKQMAEARLTKLTDYREEIKVHIREIERANSSTQGQRRQIQSAEERRMGCVLSDQQRKLVQLWDSLTKTALTVEGILNGEIPLLQTYLLRRFGRQAADLSFIIETGLEEGLAFIQDRDITSARNMFANMGFDPDSKLRQICLYTPDRGLRDYLITELKRGGKFSDAEKQMVDFVHTLESLYSCQSFEMAQVLKEEGHKREKTILQKLFDAQNEPCKSLDLESQCGELVSSEATNSETSCYSQVLLDWLRRWEPDQTSRILVEFHLGRKDKLSSCQTIPAAIAWDYMCCHLDVAHLKQWIYTQYPSADDTPRSKVVWPYDQPITTKMLESLSQCPLHLKESICDELTRRGIFVPWEQTDFDLLVRRLGRNGALFRTPHLVTKHQNKHNVTLLDLHYHMLKYCIRERLPELLYFYLDHWSLCTERNTLSEVGISTEGLPVWVSMLLHFRKAANLLFDPETVFEASLTNSNLIQRLNDTSVSSMLEQGLLVRAMATLAYNPQDLQNFVSEAPQQTVQLFGAHPQLQFALFGERLVEGRRSPELSVYDLLLNNAPLEVSRLFGWQSSNTLAIDEAPQVILHFSHEPLVAKYSYKENLRYHYYLRQGRPCYAFSAFLSEQVQSGARTLSLKRIQEACQSACLMAVRHFTDVTVAAACSAFVEMLGVNGTALRLHLEAITNINKYLCSRLTGDAEQRKEHEKLIEKGLARQIQHCLQGVAPLSNILSLLTAATYWHLDKYKIKRTSLEAGLKWHLACMFCRHHGLPMSTDFLRECAKDSNWVMFCSFAQLHQYPTDQIKELVGLFPGKNIQEHLSCVIESVIEKGTATKHGKKAGDGTRSKRKNKKDQKSPGRSGVPQATGESNDMEGELSAEDQNPADEMKGTSTGLTIRHVPDDLYSLLQTVEKHEDQAYTLCTLAVQLRNPVLSVLAGCTQDHEPLMCLCSWFLASSPQVISSALLESFTESSTNDWSLATLETITDVLIGHSLEMLLLRGLWIFQPDCLLVPYLHFHRCVNTHTDKDQCLHHLMEFKKIHRKSRSISSPVSEVPTLPVLPVVWVERTIAEMIRHFLKSCPTVATIEVMLQCLDEYNILRFFDCDVLDVSTVLKLHNVVKETNVALDYLPLSDKLHADHGRACEGLLAALHHGKYFHEARVCAEILRMPNDDITVQQLYEELTELKSSAVWETLDTRCVFWSHCQDLFTKHRVAPELASQFFMSHTELGSSHAEKAHIYKMAFDWLLQVEEGSSLDESKHELFVQMWKCRINDHLEKKDREIFPTKKQPLKKEHLVTFDFKRLNFDTVFQENPVDLTPEEGLSLDVLVGQLLNSGDIAEAIKVVQHFGCKSTDLDIIINCIKMAKGLLTPDKLKADMKKVLAGPQPRRLRRISTSTASFPRTLSMINVSSLVSQTDVEEEGDEMSVLITIQTLCQHCTHAKNCVAFILTVYRVSLMLNQRFDWVLVLEDFALIHRILASQSENRYMLAKSYIVTSSLEDSQVAGFLCDAIVEALQFCTGLIQQVCTSYGTDKPILLQPFLDSSGVGSGSSLRGNKGTGIQELIQMCEDPAVLGSRLLDTLTSMVSSNSETSRKMLTVEVELLIYANDCFTLSCHMEGISAVLRTARNLVQALLDAEEYLLMISLLTGIARYSEMTYIFDILKQQHQFELLFRKGIDRDTRLRLAILDYLQRSHPHDLDTYSMAALNFTMYREIARMLEEEAVRELKLLTGKLLENSGENQAILKKALRYYSDAAESYMKENCLRHAEGCVKQARLVALQTQLLSTKTRVIQLNRDAIKNFVTKHPKFYEAYIVCEAYSTHSFWPDALCQHVLRASSSAAAAAYLQDLRNHVSLVPSLVWEVSERYRIESQATKQMATNMKKVLSHCQDLKMTYKIASLLGFQDVVKEIKADPMSEAFLKDTGLIKT